MTNAPKIIIADKLDQYNFVTKFLADYIGKTISIDDKDQAVEIIQNLGSKINLIHTALEKNKTKISVEQIEAIINFAAQKPHLNQIAIAIIDNAENLGLEAQNKLLKLLEEPPVYLQIFLLCLPGPNSIDNIIPTVKSRCQTVIIKPVNEQGRGELNPQIRSLAELFMSNEHDLKQAYTKLNEMLKAEKDNKASKDLLKQLVIELATINSQQFSLNNFGIIRNRQQLLDEINSALKANVNTRLIVDKLFLSFLTTI